MRDFSSIKRVVVKVGTNLLTTDNGIDGKRIEDICRQIAVLKNKGYQVLLVSSGAIGMGAKELGHHHKVVHIAMRQACAALGQPLLMSAYREGFAKEHILCAQVLLTRNEMNNRLTYNNLRSSVSTLLALGCVPVFNENDVVSTAEIGSAFGDNDRMSAQVASKIDAGLLVLLTDIDGVYTGNPKTDKNAQLLRDIPEITKEVMAYAKGAGSAFSTGGMKTKLQAAEIAAMANCGTIIASGYEQDSLIRIMAGEEIGSFIHPSQALKQRERWILNNTHLGAITVDNGAKKALISHKSLLPSGICSVSGVFGAGDVVAILSEDGHIFAKAVPYYSSTDIARLVGHKSSEIPLILGQGAKDCIFRPEDLVFIEDAFTL